MALPCALRTFEPQDQPFVLARETDSLLVSQEDSGHGYREVHPSLCSYVFLSKGTCHLSQTRTKSRTTRSLPCPLCPSPPPPLPPALPE